ncbi:hypothetical protein [Actinomadura sp. 3N508]|uniref:hypothetical protein n=1 Tax=Actinomadura sp. 3N508 TaxID=3375153 RepID=UPI0037BCAA12
MRGHAIVLISWLMLAGCSAGGTGEPPAAPAATRGPSHPATPAPTFGTTAVPTGPLRLTDEMTRPGTRLRFGEKAIVPVREFYRLQRVYTEGVIGIVVHRIRTSPGSRVQGAFDEEDRATLNRHIAYYTKVTITNESGGAFTPDTSGLNADFGDWGPAVTMLGEEGLPGCREGNPPDDNEFGRKGAVWKTCLLGVSSRSRPMKAVQYDDPPYGKDVQAEDDPSPDFNKHYNLGPITWS